MTKKEDCFLLVWKNEELNKIMRDENIGKLQATELDLTMNLASQEEEIVLAQQRWEADIEDNLLRFQFASVLARSPIKEDREEALLHLGYLVTSSGEYHRDALYLLAVTKYLLEDYEGGRAAAEELLRLEPDNHQAKNLFMALKYKHDKEVEKQKETQRQIAVAAGTGLLVAAVGVGLSFLLRAKRR